MIGLAIYASIIGAVYLWIQLSLRKSWLALPAFVFDKGAIPSTSVVVIIPARNEAANIKACLTAILEQDYPSALMKVILVDDYSEDRTLEVVRSIDDDRLMVIALEERNLVDSSSPKKRAINLGIQESEAALIVTTDADCVAGQNWLRSIVTYYESQDVALIAGPVLFDPLDTSFEQFQGLDFLGMMGITGAGIQSGRFHMCNGANLAFSRKAFELVEGYKGTDHIASGDDILLAQKMVQHPDLNINYLKSTEAVVHSKPVNKISDFIAQRLRWGAKSEHYSEKQIIWIQFVVLLTCLSLLAFALLGVAFYKWHWKKYLLAFSILYLLKSIADYFSLKTYAKFFGRLDLMRGFVYASIAHIVYISVVGLLSVFIRKHEWKGRRLK